MKAFHPTHPLSANVVGKHRAEQVPPEPHCLVADVDTSLDIRSSTLRNDRGNRAYIITTKRITSGDELKYRNGLGGFALDLRLVRAS
jgi:hypothetical protein